jgi:hypothetical protein
MNPWERRSKRFLKAAIWAGWYFFVCLILNLTPRWQLLALIVLMVLCDHLLDEIWPTRSPQERADG